MSTPDTEIVRTCRILMLLTFILLVPIPATDLLLTAGFIPISYMAFYGIIWTSPIMLIYLAFGVFFCFIFYLLIKTLFSKAKSEKFVVIPITFLFILGLLLVSNQPIYHDFASDYPDRKNLTALFNDQVRAWTDYRQSQQLHEIGRARTEKMRKSTPL